MSKPDDCLDQVCCFCDGTEDVCLIDVLYEEEDGSDGPQDIQPVCRECREEFSE